MAENQTIEQWWQEDADRINAMGEAARKAGVTVSVDPGDVDLDDDGNSESDIED